MRRIFIALLLALAGAGISQAQVSPIRGWCESGAQQVVLAGLNSTTQVQASFPQCTVTVSIHGDGAATIFADANSTPLGNPFTAQTNGQWIFYVASGRYDVQLSGAGFPTPITYSDIFTTGAGGATVLPGGSPIQTQVNNNGAFGGTPCESFTNILTGPENVSCDWHSRGPNPNVDIMQFGARVCQPNSSPCGSGVTASISSASTSATVSTTSCPGQAGSTCFVNGDGVVIYGAGPSQSLTTPTGLAVSNVLAVSGTGTGIVNPGATTGSTTRCYKIIARDTGGGFTAASSEVCNTTGQAALGAVTINLTSCTRSTVTVTCTTASPTPLLVGGGGNQLGEVYIGGGTGTIDNSFRGFYEVQLAADSTHFVVINNLISTLNGALASTTGGTATFYVANHLTWNAVTGAWLYYIYEGAAGAETLIGVSRPNQTAAGNLDTTFDDFGPTFLAGYIFPPWIPTTPPVSAQNDNLSTTIVSGAGTTNLILANAAGATVSGAGIRIDAGVAIAKAATLAGFYAPTYIPNDPSGTGLPFVVNNFCDLRSTRVAIYQSGLLFLNETLAIGLNGAPVGAAKWTGTQNTAYNGNGGSAGGGGADVAVKEASPGVYDGGGNDVFVDGVNFHAPFSTNGALLFLVDGAGGAFNAHFLNSTFNTSSSTSDLMGFGLYLRFVTDVYLDKMSFINGNSADGASHNTPFFCSGCASVHVLQSALTHRGYIVATQGGGGGPLSIDNTHYNGGGTPLLTITGNAYSVYMGHGISMDTVGHQCLASLTGKTIINNDICNPSGYPVFNGPPITGGVQFSNGGNGLFNFENSLLTNQITSGQRFSDGSPDVVQSFSGPGAMVVGPQDSFAVSNAAQAAPTCSVSAGGSIPIGANIFLVEPFWQGNLEGVPSPTSASCTTTTGNQTITVNWVATPGNPIGYRIFSGSPGNCCIYQTGSGLVTGTSFVFTSLVGPGFGVPATVPLGGPTELMPGAQGIATPALILGGSQSVTGVQGTDTNFLSSGTISASTGVSLCTDANHGATTSGCPSAGTFYQTVDANATAQTQRPVLNLISGTNATVSCVDNAGATRTDCTFAANATTLWSSITAATNANAGTFAATGNTWDFSGATSFKVPVAGGAAPTADGTIADNSTTHGLNFGSNGNTLNVAVASTGAGGTGTTCAANSAVTAVSNTAAPTCTQLTGGGLPYTNWGVNSSCAQTGSGAGNTQTCTISFNTTEANTSYKIVCGGTGTITGYPFMQGVITKNTTSAVVQYTNGTSNEAVVSGWANIECIVTR